MLEMAEHHHTCLSGDAGERNERDHDCSREVAPEPPERTTDERLSATGRERWRNDRDRYDPCLKLRLGLEIPTLLGACGIGAL